jgi:hypothetical protein
MDNATSHSEAPLVDFNALTEDGYHDYTDSFGEGWGSTTEMSAYNPATVTPILTLKDVFLWMTTYPGMVLVGTMTTGGNITNIWRDIIVS